MRKLSFTILPGVGSTVHEHHGSVLDLLVRLPYVILPGRPLPPLAVLNDTLSKGKLDAGMSGGCLWEPFELSETEYAEIVREIEKEGIAPPVATPPWVKTRRDWQEWLSRSKPL